MAAAILATEQGWRIDGDINYRTVVALRRQGDDCLEQSNPECRFDFAAVGQVNTAALALLLSWRRKAQQLGVELRYSNVPPALIAIAQMSDLEVLFREPANKSIVF